MQRNLQETSSFRFRRTLTALPALALLAFAPAATAQGNAGDDSKLAPYDRRGDAGTYSAVDLAGTWVGQLKVAGHKGAGLLFRVRFDAQGQLVDLVDATGRSWDASNSLSQVQVAPSGAVRIRMLRVHDGTGQLELLGSLDAASIENAGQAKFIGDFSDPATDPLYASGVNVLDAGRAQYKDAQDRLHRFDDSGLQYDVEGAGSAGGIGPRNLGLEDRFHSPDGLEGKKRTPKNAGLQRRRDEDIVWPADPNDAGNLHRPTDPGSMTYAFSEPVQLMSYRLVRVGDIDPQMPKGVYETWFTAQGIVEGAVSLEQTEKTPEHKDFDSQSDAWVPPPTFEDRKDMDVFKAGRLEGGIFIGADGSRWVLRFGITDPQERLMQGVMIDLESGEARFIQAQKRLRDAGEIGAN